MRDLDLQGGQASACPPFSVYGLLCGGNSILVKVLWFFLKGEFNESVVFV